MEMESARTRRSSRVPYQGRHRIDWARRIMDALMLSILADLHSGWSVITICVRCVCARILVSGRGHVIQAKPRSGQVALAPRALVTYRE